MVVKNLKGDSDMPKDLKELKVDLHQKDGEVESLKKEYRDLRSQVDSLTWDS